MSPGYYRSNGAIDLYLLCLAYQCVCYPDRYDVTAPGDPGTPQHTEDCVLQRYNKYYPASVTPARAHRGTPLIQRFIAIQIINCNDSLVTNDQ